MSLDHPVSGLDPALEGAAAAAGAGAGASGAAWAAWQARPARPSPPRAFGVLFFHML